MVTSSIAADELQHQPQPLLGNVSCADFLNGTLPRCEIRTSLYSPEYIKACLEPVKESECTIPFCVAMVGAMLAGLLCTGAVAAWRLKEVQFLSRHSENTLHALGLSPAEEESVNAYRERLLAVIQEPDFTARYKRVETQLAAVRPFFEKFDEKEAGKFRLPYRSRSEFAGITGSPLFDKNTLRLVLSLAGKGRPRAATIPVPLEPSVASPPALGSR